MSGFSISRSSLRNGNQFQCLRVPSRLLTTSRINLTSGTETELPSGENHTAIPNAATAQSPESHVKDWAKRLDTVTENSRLPRSVQAIYLRPLRRKATYGLPVCDVQLRSYSVQNVQFFADFAIRAAYYLNLPISGPVPLPRIVERWTVPRSNFVHKKSQENFERITLRRLIQVKDGNPQVVQAWLAFLRKHAFYGVGMKANVWNYESLDVSKSMDEALPEVEKSLGPELAHFGQRKGAKSDSSVFDHLSNERFSHNKGLLASVRKD